MYMSVYMDWLASDTSTDTFGCFVPQKLDFNLKF